MGSMLKNILVVALIGVTIFGIYKFNALQESNDTVLREFYALRNETAGFLAERDSMLQELEQERAISGRLREEKEAMRRYILASQRKIRRLYSRYNDLLAVLESDRQQQQATLRENAALKEKLSSLPALKQAIREVKRNLREQAHQLREEMRTDTELWGNRGYLIRNGEPTFFPKVTIEVNPAISYTP